MPTTVSNYFVNLTKLARGDRVLHPLIATYYVTTQCNFNCAYCEYFGRRSYEVGRSSDPRETRNINQGSHLPSCPSYLRGLRVFPSSVRVAWQLMAPD